MEKGKYNVWRFSPEVKNSTGGWEFFVKFTALSEESARASVSRQYNIPLYAVKAYPHIDNLAALA